MNGRELDIMPGPGRGSSLAHFGWLFTLAYLFFLIYPLRDLLRSDLTLPGLLLTLVATAVFVAVYLYLMLFRVFPEKPVPAGVYRTEALLIATLAGGALALPLIHGGAWLGLFIYVSVAAGMRLRTAAAIRAILGLTVLAAVLGWILGAGWLEGLQLTILTAAVGMSMVGWVRMIATVRELQAAREEIARLAVSEERLRFARDLHDLLGHSLSLITIKSELAGRLLPDAPDKAASEVRDVERVAREALREVREAVSGYRNTTLRSELDGAREMLEAAGVRCRVEAGAGELPSHTEAVLAWTVREGVTNVIRHSRAPSCEIRIIRDAGTVGAEVLDAGHGSIEAEAAPSGSGLSGLAERVAASGGRSEAGPEPGGGFKLCVTLPIKAEEPVVHGAEPGSIRR